MKKFYSLLLLAAISLFGAQNLMAQDTWTVAGSSEALFGSEWAPSNAANDMVYNNEDGLFHFDKTNVQLSAGTIYFKVVKNHSWGEAYPSENYSLAIPESGKYNIAITFNETSHAIVATASLVEAGDVNPVIKIAGTFTAVEWSAVTLDEAQDHLTASVTIAVDDASVYGIKLVVGGDWMTFSDLNNWITRVYHADWEFPVVSSYGDEAHIDMDMAGEYTFTYTFATQKLTVTYPQTYTRHFEHAYYSTICLPQAATLANATAYEIASIADGYVSLSEPVANLVAGKPYIIKPTADDVDVVATLSGDPTDNTVPGANGLWGVIDQDGEPSVQNGNYVLSENTFRLVAGGTVNVPRFRGGLWVDAQGAPELRIAENATNIESLDASENAVKFIKNGQLFIQKNGVVYNAVGAVVE